MDRNGTSVGDVIVPKLRKLDRGKVFAGERRSLSRFRSKQV